MIDETEFRRRVQEAVITAFSVPGDITTTSIAEALIVQLMPIVKQEQRSYNMSELREMLQSIL